MTGHAASPGGTGPRPTVAFVAPLLPGCAQADRDAMASCRTGECKPARESSRRRAGITRESTWIQPTPFGGVADVVIEADDLDVAFRALGSSEEPFDACFRDHVRTVQGIALEDGFPPPEPILDYRSDHASS
jgi:hypothetical protein